MEKMLEQVNLKFRDNRAFNYLDIGRNQLRPRSVDLYQSIKTNMKVILLRFWYRNNDHLKSEDAKAIERHQESATTRTLLDIDVPESTTVGELRKLLHEEAKRVDPQDDALDSTWTKIFASKLPDNCDFAFSDAESFSSRVYIAGDDNTTLGEILKQQNAPSGSLLNNIRRKSSVTSGLTLYVTERRPPPGNLYFKTLTGAVHAIYIPEENFGRTTLEEAVCILSDQTGLPRDQIRLVYQGSQMTRMENTLDVYNIRPQATFNVVLRLRANPSPNDSTPQDTPPDPDTGKHHGHCTLS
jgi:hypothetical protein